MLLTVDLSCEEGVVAPIDEAGWSRTRPCASTTGSGARSMP